MRELIQNAMDAGVDKPVAFALFSKGLSLSEVIAEGKRDSRDGSGRTAMRNMRRWRNKKETGVYNGQRK